MVHLTETNNERYFRQKLIPMQTPGILPGDPILRIADWLTGGLVDWFFHKNKVD